MKTKILVVEDEKIINDYITLCLKQEDYHVESVLNGKQAIEAINRSNFHIIVSDIMMSPVDGYQLLQHLKENNLKIPVIMLTALDTVDSLMQCYNLGCIDYLTKPVNKELLISKIKVLSDFLYDINSDVQFNSNSLSVIIAGDEFEFTRIEYEIFKLLYNNSPRVYGKDSIIEIIWFNNNSMSEKIVDVNIFNIRKKLGKYSYLIKNKRTVGYYYEDQK